MASAQRRLNVEQWILQSAQGLTRALAGLPGLDYDRLDRHQLRRRATPGSCASCSSPHFSRPLRNAHSMPTSVGASRESVRPGKLLPEQLATGDLLTNPKNL